MDGQLSSCFRISEHVGTWWHGANGAVQGCALSLHRGDLLTAVLAMRVQRAAPLVSFGAFIDDANFRAPSSNTDSLHTAWQESLRFDRLTDSRTNVKKFWPGAPAPPRDGVARMWSAPRSEQPSTASCSAMR